MRTPALLLLLAILLCSCASPTAVIDRRVLQCGPGQDIEVRAGMEGAGQSSEMMGEITYLVEVANNSHNDVTVKTVRIDPDDRNAAGVESAYQAFDQIVAAGDDFLFRLPVSKTWSGGSLERPARQGQTSANLYVTVGLTNGDTYRCPFALDVR